MYRTSDTRRFHNDAGYREGRLRGAETRYRRAIETKSRRGHEFAFGAWVADEYKTLRILHEAGAAVPGSVAQSGAVILMEYLGSRAEPAPMLSQVSLGRDEAQRVFDLIVSNIELSLACHRVHGDLSAFNVLYRDGDVRIIDFPQAVDARFNHNALPLLQRDVANVHQYLARFGAAGDPAAIARDLWARFLRADL